MKKLFLASAAALVTLNAGGSALAADIPVKVKAPPPIAYYDWSGIYLGLSLGGVWAEVDRFYPRLDLVHLVPQTFTSRNEDAIVGFHGGVQWQWGPWVIGAEVAYSKGWRDISGTVSLSPPEPFTTLGAYNKIAGLLTAGPRLGYAWDRLLVFATGGYAGGSIDGQYVCTATGLAVAPGPACGIFGPGLADLNATGHTWNHGWYAGAGFEYVVHKGSLVDVIVGAEYQHFELNSETAFCLNPGCAIVGPQDHLNFEHKARGDLARARLTVKSHGWSFFWN
jgi:outer membrane immunogenic protein